MKIVTHNMLHDKRGKQNWSAVGGKVELLLSALRGIELSLQMVEYGDTPHLESAEQQGTQRIRT